MNYISRTRAKQEFQKGKKIAHNFFGDGEFIKLNSDNEMEDEEGLVLNAKNFWEHRNVKSFDNGWYIVE